MGSDNNYSYLDGTEIGPDNFEDESDEERARFEWKFMYTKELLAVLKERIFFLRICENQLQKN